MNCTPLLEALKDQRLTRTDLAILGALIRIDGHAPPTRKEVALEANCAPSSVPRSARKLEELGYVERIVDVRDHGGRAKPTGYRLKADTYRDGHVPNSVHSQIDTLELAFKADQKPQDQPARIEPDTSKSPPMINNSTPQELYPETLELGGSRSRARPNGWDVADLIVERVSSPYLDPSKGTGGLYQTSARIKFWIENQHADLEEDIIPAITLACQRMNGHGRAIQSWKYFDGIVVETVAKRIASQIDPIQTPKVSHDREPTIIAGEPVAVRRGPVSKLTAARMQRRADREAQSQPLDLGRVDSLAIS